MIDWLSECVSEVTKWFSCRRLYTLLFLLATPFFTWGSSCYRNLENEAESCYGVACLFDRFWHEFKRIGPFGGKLLVFFDLRLKSCLQVAWFFENLRLGASKKKLPTKKMCSICAFRKIYLLKGRGGDKILKDTTCYKSDSIIGFNLSTVPYLRPVTKL